jgi:hypothetical protein
MRSSFRIILGAAAFLLPLVGVCGVAAQPPAQAEKKVAFEMRAVAWKRVLEWLTDHTGLPITSNDPPPSGTFTFISPMREKEPATYTTAEIIDLINEQLLTRKHLLIRGEKSLQLVSTDDKIDPSQVPQVEVADLAKRGKSELVAVTLTVEKIGGPDDIKEIRKLLGPFGAVVILAQKKRIVLQDTAGNLRKICKVVGADEPAAAPKREPAKKDEPPAPPKKQAAADRTLRYVFLTEITHAAKGAEALVKDRKTGFAMRLRVSADHATLTFENDADLKTEVRCKVVRIDSRDVFIQAGDRIYAIHVGENLKDALARPLDPGELKKLGLAIEK